MAGKKKTIIKLSNISRILTDEEIPVTLVQDINCDIKAGEFISITGASGSGKSSLMYLLGLLDDPTEGSIIIDGLETTKASDAEKEHLRLEKLGFVFQFHFLLEEFSVLDNVMLPMRKLGVLSNKEMKKRAEYLLGNFGLEEMGWKKPRQLSGGERQRVAVARALANNPKVVLADEPTGNLDTHNAETVFHFFEKLSKEEGITVIIITHDPDLAKRADRRIHLVDGKIQ